MEDLCQHLILAPGKSLLRLTGNPELFETGFDSGGKMILKNRQTNSTGVPWEVLTVFTGKAHLQHKLHKACTNPNFLAKRGICMLVSYTP